MLDMVADPDDARNLYGMLNALRLAPQRPAADPD